MSQQNKTADTDLTTGLERRLRVILILLVSLFIEYFTGNGLGLVVACRTNNTEVTVVDPERKLYSELLIFKLKRVIEIICASFLAKLVICKQRQQNISTSGYPQCATFFTH